MNFSERVTEVGGKPEGCGIARVEDGWVSRREWLEVKMKYKTAQCIWQHRDHG